MEMMVGWVSVDAAVDSSAEHTQAGPDSHTVLNRQYIHMFCAISYICTYTNKFAKTHTGPDSHTVLHIHILFLLLVLLVKHIHTQTNLQKT